MYIINNKYTILFYELYFVLVVHFLDIQTEESYTYDTAWISLVNKTSLVFRVSACKDAHVLLSGAMYDVDQESYDIHIGSGKCQVHVQN